LGLQSLDSEDGAVGGVAVVGAAATVEFFGVFGGGQQNGVVGTEALVPADERRLLVEVAIEEVGFGEVALNLDEDGGGQICGLVGDDFGLEPLHAGGSDPRVHVAGGFHQFGPADGLPLLGRVESLAHVLDAHVLHQRRKRAPHKLLLHELTANTSVKATFSGLHIFINYNGKYFFPLISIIFPQQFRSIFNLH
jgi:hypothetical protein